MRGEDTKYFLYVAVVAGSPPHARGRRSYGDRRAGRPGITPACAGKTCPRQRAWLRRPDHPRMRGEDVLRPVRVPFQPGSPPHARGRRATSGRLRRSRRITPACAGKTSYGAVRHTGDQDHPRMRGEDAAGTMKSRSNDGSPPHARGRPNSPALRLGQRRITPACAGKTVRFPRESGKVVFQLTSFLLLST